jgi:hypothetical protein
VAPSALSAQDKFLHLNPVVAKLAEGKTVYGLITSDLSLANARETARAPVDFVYRGRDSPKREPAAVGEGERGTDKWDLLIPLIADDGHQNQAVYRRKTASGTGPAWSPANSDPVSPRASCLVLSRPIVFLRFIPHDLTAIGRAVQDAAN